MWTRKKKYLSPVYRLAGTIPNGSCWELLPPEFWWTHHAELSSIRGKEAALSWDV